LVERFFNKIKQCRRIATRYDKLAATYLAFIKLASIRIWLRAYGSAPWPQRACRSVPRPSALAVHSGASSEAWMRLCAARF
jgi:hypothetical protein